MTMAETASPYGFRYIGAKRRTKVAPAWSAPHPSDLLIVCTALNGNNGRYPKHKGDEVSEENRQAAYVRHFIKLRGSIVRCV